MTKEELIVALRQIKDGTYKYTPSWPGAEAETISGSTETNHMVADDLLCAYINDPEITAAFHNIHKWYS